MRRMIIIISIISGLYASTIYAQSSSEFVPDAATVALWHLNGNGDDVSGSENGLAVKADRISWLSGVFNQCAEMGNDPWSGSCLDSDGGALTASGSGCTYPGSGDWTVEAWVLFQSNSDRYDLVSHCSEDANGPGPYRLFIESGKVCFQLEDSNNSIMIQSDISPFVDLWVHLAGVYRNGQGTELYVDGLRVACMATTLIPETLPNYNVFVGGSFCGTSTGLEIDEVRISNVARYGNPESETDLCLMVTESPDQIIPDDLIITDHSSSYAESIIIIGTGTSLSRPRINDNGEVVWSHEDDVKGHTIYSSTRGQISDGPKDREPDINNDGEIIWRFGDGGGEGANGIQSDLRGIIYLGWYRDPHYDTHRINNMGEIVYNRNLWRFGEKVEEIWSNTRGRLTYSPDYTTNRRCAINDSGEVVYASYSSTDEYYDIISTERGVITNDHPYPLKGGPDINNDGEIVWHEKGEGGVWSVWSNVRGKIGDGRDPSINDIGEIVWQSIADGDEQIYSNIRGQITNNNEDNKRPQINNNGRITWLVNLNQIALFPETAPVANAGGPYIVEAMDWWEQVELDGSGSYDPESDEITYEWDLDLAVDSDDPPDGDPANDVDATGVNPEVLFPIGQTEISLVVTDSYGVKSGPDVTTVTISVINVDVEIRSDDGADTINLESDGGVVRVMFLTDASFDAKTVDPMTVVLEGMSFADGLVQLRGKNDTVPMVVDQDYDGDGDIDRVVNLDTERLTADGLDVDCWIGALTYDGYVVLGVDIAHLAPVYEGVE